VVPVCYVDRLQYIPVCLDACCRQVVSLVGSRGMQQQAAG
jgi:hypothetical protein